MKNIYDFLEEFEIYLKKKADNELWVYSGHSYYGSLLIKNPGNNKRILLKPSDSINPLGGKKIQDSISKTPRYKGFEISNYIFIANSFKEIANRIAKSNKQITLVSVNIQEKSITVNGAMNLDLNVLNHIIEFANSLEFEISYDFQGLLKHQGFDQKKEKTITQIEERVSNPVVFFSYSWDSDEHRFWVLKLASELIKNGIDVLIDEWDLARYNNDLHVFMESGIRNSDKVVMICTPSYSQKANDRQGGVGVENTIITGEFYDKLKVNKFISIVRKYDNKIVDSLPSYLKTKFSIDFSNDSEFRIKVEELERKILNIPRFKKPNLGKLVTFESNEI